MAIYIEDPNGVVHVTNNDGNGEFTFCDREFGCFTGDNFESYQEFAGETVTGPATCKECHEAIAEIRKSITGAKWSRKLIDPDEDSS